MPMSAHFTRRSLLESSLGAGAASLIGGSASVASPAAGDQRPVVATKQGAVRGVFDDGGAIFRGIPYAQAPVGKLRFKPPVRAARWEGVRDAAKFGAFTPQSHHPLEVLCYAPGTAMGDDCLNLNVWTPSPGRTGLPVFVWIHGGSFQWGTGSAVWYDGATFARDGVVCVTLNYRLGTAGFLNVGDEPGTGAFGLLDQIAALEWVQENIAAFGGNPAQVTVAGESAGGFSVGHLLAAANGRGLFRRAIMQSGGAHLHIARKASVPIGEAVLARLGTRFGDVEGIANLKTAELIAAQSALEPTFPTLIRQAGCTDPVTLGLVQVVPTYGADVLPEPATAAIASGASRDVDLLIGTNQDEASMFWPSPEVQAFARPSLEVSLDTAFRNAGRSGAQVLADYHKLDASTNVTSGIVPAGTDLIFRMPSLRVAEAKLKHNANTWMYLFAWDGTLGATHAIDVGFVFESLGRGHPEAMKMLGVANGGSRALASTMHGAWVNFAKSGKPHHRSLPPWPRYDLGRRMTMVLNETSALVSDPEAERRKLWTDAKY